MHVLPNKMNDIKCTSVFLTVWQGVCCKEKPYGFFSASTVLGKKKLCIKAFEIA